MTRPARHLLLAVLLAGGCSFELDPCAADEDCPTGSVCARPTGTAVPMCLAPEEQADEDASATPVDDPDATRPDDDVGRPDPVDLGDTDRPALDCPTVTSCGEQEPNDREDDAIFLSRFAEGCAGFGFEPWSAIHQDSLCDGDVDQFVIEYVACERGAYRLTVSLTPPAVCAAGGELRIAEGLYDCEDTNVRCETVDGAQRITIIVPDGEGPQPVERIRFAVSPGRAPQGLDYILRATMDR